jgi:two-component system response regulator BaeR
MSGERILVVEDEPRLARVLAEYLERAGFAPQLLGDGAAVVPWVRAHAPDLVVLDLMLPGRDGLDICRDIRSFSQVPVIMVTARVEEVDRLLGLELGADDYVCKPYSPREVVARVRAVLRRHAPAAASVADAPRADDPLLLDEASYRVRAAGREAELTVVEFQLLQTLYRQPGRIFSRAQLMDRIYADRRVVSDRTIDSHVKKLRRKLARLLPGQELVHAVYGAGYRYEPRAHATGGGG